VEVRLRRLFIPYFKMKKNTSNPIQTMLVICVGFMIIYLVSNWQPAIYISLIAGLIGIFSAYLSRKIEIGWMKLAWVLSFIVPNIILTLVFYLILFPVSLLSKLFQRNKNPLQLKNNCNSMFIERNKTFDAADFKNPW